MLDFPSIPLAPRPERLAQEAGIPLEEARERIAAAAPWLTAAGVMDEVEPAVVFITKPPDNLTSWGETALIGLCALKGDAPAPGADPAADALADLALQDALGFIEYKARLFLKPFKRSPGPRLIPGCGQLPAAANRDIIRYFQPNHALGLTVNHDDAVSGGRGAAFVHPEEAVIPGAACRSCTKKNCPLKPIDAGA